MRLGDLCPAPCFPRAAAFEVPAPGCVSQKLRFDSEGERDFFAVLLNNHDPRMVRTLNPKVAIVGLSPAGNQISDFVTTYRETGDYGRASVAGAFAGLAKDIIAMIEGLGLADKLGLTFPQPDSLAGHPDIHVTSLVACATLGENGTSDAFDPMKLSAARRCILRRFVPEMTNPAFSRLSHVLILGSDGWSTVNTLRADTGATVVGLLRSNGKIVLNLPHPSKQNKEYVNLASLTHEQFPALDNYVTAKWEAYRLEPPRKGRGKEPEAKYKAKRRTVWRTINELRTAIARMDDPGR
jgi:hypothetical protein